MFRLLIFSLIPFLLISCNECGDSIQLGAIALAEASIDFVPYTSNQTITFVDNSGTRHTLHSINGIQITEGNMTVRTLCQEGFLDAQKLFYDTQRLQIAFFDSSGVQIFYVDLTTAFEDSFDIDSIAIHDIIRVSSSLYGHHYGGIQIITEDRQFSTSDFYKNELLGISEYVGDTTLYERFFEDVYKGRSLEGREIYYNNTKGVLAFIINTDEYWVLE